ncbi:hypothetical protein EBR57_06615, partial [bacterium]|nr:hypothetical protein [bacterium]
MWAPNLDEQFRVLKGGASSVSSGTTVAYSPFVEPKTGAPIPGDQFQISKPGISDALLRQTVINWANSPESGLSQ